MLNVVGRKNIDGVVIPLVVGIIPCKSFRVCDPNATNVLLAQETQGPQQHDIGLRR